ncbi:arginyltransferase [Magnetovibrio sp.]|uniref:arginyltransferase n=1 Tax=Magnetovibrio sp. TaxID=2024836 RepID=UPI002F932DA0
MRHNLTSNTHFFFTTTPLPCPYLEDRLERRMVTELMGPDATVLNDKLSLAGFRRSHTIAYAPVCDGCSACVSVRVPVRDFAANRTQRRIWSRNADLVVGERAAIATREQYELFKRYIDTRHGDGDMALMGHSDYRALVEETPVRSNLVEFRDADGQLLAGCLTDRLGDGLSAVYSFFDTSDAKRSLGTYVVMWLIQRARDLGLDFVYLGYWVQGSPKMDYKRNFRPLEAYTPNGWKRLPAAQNRKPSNT